MIQQEIQERNKQIALMLGWEEATLEYKLKWCAVPTEERLNKLDPQYIPILMKENKAPLWQDSLMWNKDWNWLMEAVDFVKKNLRCSNDTENAKLNEYFIDKWDFKVKSYNVTLMQWTNNGWRMFDDKNKDLSMLYVIGENCESEKEAVFLIISNIAKLYNKNKLN